MTPVIAVSYDSGAARRLRPNSPPAVHRWVGQAVRRVEDPPLLTGEGQFLADLRQPGLLHAVFVRSPLAHARMQGLDVEQAKGMPGVVTVIAGEDLDTPDLVDLLRVEGLRKTPQPPLARDRVLAAQDVRAKLLRVAGALLEVAPADLDVQRSRVYVRGAPDRALTVAEVAAAAYFNAHARGADPLLSATRFYDPLPAYANGCFVAVVEVVPETGSVRVLRAVGVEDCGTVLNPLIVDGQTCGAIAQAIGAALFEQLIFDADGQSLASTFLDYAQPRAACVPPITVRHLCSPTAGTIGGVKGMGESGMLAAPAAVINAVADALAPFGGTFTQLPLTPERVWRLAAIDFAN